MNSKVNKSCAVPLCPNTSLKTPNKLFVYVPHNKTTRYKWLELARRDPKSIKLNTVIYFCEDHFDFPNDMENFMEYRVMGSVSQVRMKPGWDIPTKFQCQPDRRKRASNITERPYIIKKTKIIEEAIRDLEEGSSTTKHLKVEETSSNPVVHENIQNITQENKTADKSIQVYMTHKFRSKAVQMGIKFVSQMTSPLKPECLSVSTSPINVTRCITNITPTKSNRNIFATEDC